MHWHLVHTKPRQEEWARVNLERQGHVCFLPLMLSERLYKGRLQVSEVPLFPRYLFIRSEPAQAGAGLASVRSTLGVSRLVCFGSEPARVDERLVEALRSREGEARPRPLFEPGTPVCITQGPFAGIEAVYQMADGDSRVRVLIELLHKPVALRISPTALRRL